MKLILLRTLPILAPIVLVGCATPSPTTAPFTATPIPPTATPLPPLTGSDGGGSPSPPNGMATMTFT
jgi:hypothetical protein